MSLTIPIRYVRAARTLASRQDWDFAEVLDDARVSPLLLGDLRSRVTTEQATLIARAMWRHTGDELFGLGPAPVPRGTFRLLGYGVLSASDAREALNRLAAFSPALPGIPPVHVVVGDEVTTLSIDTSVLADQDGLLADSVLALCHRFTGWLIDSRVPLVAVQVPYPRPEDTTLYTDVFGMVPDFDAPDARLVLANTVLDAPLVRDASQLESFVSEAPAGLLARREYGSTLADQVRRILERDLACDLSAEEVSARLMMAGPTMRRLLREQGTSYRRIREDLRRDTAVEELAHSDITVTELSRRLGFSEVSAFVRAFRRWTGMPPSAYRAAAGAQGVPGA